jgi:hypothetical protein
MYILQNMDTLNFVKLEIFHKDYNLDKKDNLSGLPEEKAIFGVFAIVNDMPMNCRYIGETENMKESIKNLFENPQSAGLKKFMQGAWIKMLLYEPLKNISKEECQKKLEDWNLKYTPIINEEGEYPGYYNY